MFGQTSRRCELRKQTAHSVVGYSMPSMVLNGIDIFRFLLFRKIDCIVLKVLVTSTPHNILSKPLAAFQPLSKQRTVVREE